MELEDLLQHCAHPIDIGRSRVDHILLIQKQRAGVGHECPGDVSAGTEMPIDSSHSTSNWV